MSDNFRTVLSQFKLVEEDMKRIVVVFSLACIALPLFADDAMVLPAKVFRLTIAPSYGMVPGTYNTSGSYSTYSSGQGSVTAFNMGFALEYGFNDWISGAVQWTPGWNVTSSVDYAGMHANVNGLNAAFVGAKVQLVGEKAPIKSETIRFCPALGVKVPFGGLDFSQQYTNYQNGSNVTVINNDKQTLGVGGRIYADVIFSSAFYLNLFSEFIYYPGKVAFKDVSFANYATYLTYLGFGVTFNPDVSYGYDLKVELEPHYIYSLSDAIQLEGSLPVTYFYFPGQLWNGAAPSLPLGGGSVETSEAQFILTPTVSVFLLKSPIPFPVRLKLAYSFPVVGWNTTTQYGDKAATNALILILQMYLKFF